MMLHHVLQPNWAVPSARSFAQRPRGLASSSKPRPLSPRNTTTSHKYRPQFEVNIRTFDPRRLGPSDIVNLSKYTVGLYDRQFLVPRARPTEGGAVWQRRKDISDNDWDRFGRVQLSYYKVLWHHAGRSKVEISPNPKKCWFYRIAFPPDTRGWFYYHRPPNHPDVAGGIRFRLVPNEGPPEFERGTDLYIPTGVPYVISLLDISALSSYDMLSSILLRDRLIDHDLLARCRAVFEAAGVKRFMRSLSQFIFSLDDLFMINLGQLTSRIWIWSDGGLHHWNSIKTRVTRFSRSGGDHYTLEYSGTIICRFERSTLEQHAGRRVLLVRVVKVLEPVRLLVPDRDPCLVEPSEGELLYRKGKPISMDVDKVNAADGSLPLRALYDSKGSGT